MIYWVLSSTLGSCHADPNAFMVGGFLSLPLDNGKLIMDCKSLATLLLHRILALSNQTVKFPQDFYTNMLVFYINISPLLSL